MLLRIEKCLAAAGMAFILVMSAPALADDYQYYSGFLTNYEMFEPGPEDGVDRLWLNPNFNLPNDFAKYSSVMIDPLRLYLSDDAQDEGFSPDELAALTSEFRQILFDSIKDRYEVTTVPGPGVLRILIALTDIDTSEVVLDEVTSIMPTARVLSFLKEQITGSHSFVGSATIEAILLDGGTGETIAAFVDHRSGDKGIVGGVDSMEDAREAFEWWGERLRKLLDEAYTAN